MRTFRTARTVFLLAIALPMLVSCSGERTSPGDDKSIPEKDQRDKTIADYTEKIQANPEAANDRGELAYYKRGGVYAAKGEHEKAIADYTEAIRLYPLVKSPYLSARMIEVYDARATSYQKNKQYDKAIADYSEVIQGGHVASPDIGEAMAFGGLAALAHRNRGLCYDEQGQREKALADYKKAVEMEPSLLDDDLKKRMGE